MEYYRPHSCLLWTLDQIPSPLFLNEPNRRRGAVVVNTEWAKAVVEESKLATYCTVTDDDITNVIRDPRDLPRVHL